MVIVLVLLSLVRLLNLTMQVHRLAVRSKQEGLEVILINSNPATIMTDNAMADKIYIEPLTLETVKRVIKKRTP